MLDEDRKASGRGERGLGFWGHAVETAGASLGDILHCRVRHSASSSMSPIICRLW